MTARNAHGSAVASSVVAPLFRRPGAGHPAAAVRTESFITELTSAMGHLERALEVGQTPARFLLPDGATVTPSQLDVWVAQHTARAQNILAQITALYADSQT